MKSVIINADDFGQTEAINRFDLINLSFQAKNLLHVAQSTYDSHIVNGPHFRHAAGDVKAMPIEF